MKVVLALLCSLFTLVAALAQNPLPSTSRITLGDYTAKLDEFSGVALVAVNNGFLDTYSLIQATDKSPVLVSAQFAKTQTVNLLRELESLDQISKRTAAQKASSKQIVAHCLWIMQRQANTPLGQQFSMPADDPFLLALAAEKVRLEKHMKDLKCDKNILRSMSASAKSFKTDVWWISVSDVMTLRSLLSKGCKGRHCRGSTIQIPITRDGVYKYVDTNGAFPHDREIQDRQIRRLVRKADKPAREGERPLALMYPSPSRLPPSSVFPSMVKRVRSAHLSTKPI